MAFKVSSFAVVFFPIRCKIISARGTSLDFAFSKAIPLVRTLAQKLE